MLETFILWLSLHALKPWLEKMSTCPLRPKLNIAVCASPLWLPESYPFLCSHRTSHISPWSSIGRTQVESKRLFTLVHMHCASHKESVVLLILPQKWRPQTVCPSVLHLCDETTVLNVIWGNFLIPSNQLFVVLSAVSRFPSPGEDHYNQTLLRCIIKSC